MKEKIKTFFCVLILLCALPYIITVVLQGKADTETGSSALDMNHPQEGMPDIEETVIGIIAGEMPVTYAAEALKAQAVIARTNLMTALEKGEEPPKSISREEMKKMWRSAEFSGNYQKLSDAVNDTKGVVITRQGEYIYAAFHAVSAGKTRSAAEALKNDNIPWLVSVESSEDITSEDYLKVVFWEKETFSQQLNQVFPEVALDPENPLNAITVDMRDSGDYVTRIKVGEKIISGEEFRNALNLNSACFYLKEVEGKIRIVTKGLGHGLGLSQYGANALARQGKTYREILSYYFKNIEISD